LINVNSCVSASMNLLKGSGQCGLSMPSLAFCPPDEVDLPVALLNGVFSCLFWVSVAVGYDLVLV